MGGNAILNRTWRIFIFSAVCLCSAISAESRFERVVTEEGVSTGTIHQIFQDRVGFIWLATGNGLIRYDGYSFLTYIHDPDDPNSISGNDVRCIVEDPEGNLWIGTLGYGLNYFVRDEDRFVPYRHDPSDPGSLPWDEIVSMVIDADGSLWLGLWFKGFAQLHLETGIFTLYSTIDSYLTNSNVHHVFEDRDGFIWIGTRRGLNRYDKHTGIFTAFLPDSTMPDGMRGEYIYGLFQDRTGLLWIGTDEAMNVYDPTDGTFRYFTRPDEIGILHSPLRVRSICEDEEGNIWFGSEGGGVYIYNRADDSMTVFRHDRNNHHSLSSNAVRSLLIDRTGVVWVGTTATGLLKHNPKRLKFRHIYSYLNGSEQIPIGTVHGVYEAKDGYIWIGTHGNGLIRYRLSDGTGTAFYHIEGDPQSLPDNTIQTLFEHVDGSLWAGTFASGLVFFDPAKGIVTSRDHDHSTLPPLIRISHIYSDSRNMIWVASDGAGLFRTRYDNTEFNRFHPGSDPVFGATHIWRVLEARTGKILIGTWGYGLYSYDYSTHTFNHIPLDRSNPDALTSQVVVSLAEDGSGTIWAGTWGSGIFALEPESGTIGQYTIMDGLPHNNVYGILIDDDDNVWISTSNGIARLYRETGAWISYDERDGVQSTEFSNGAYHRGRSGRFYFGGLNGFNVFFPREIIDNHHVPPIVITSVKLFGEEMPHSRYTSNEDMRRSVALEHYENTLSFEFSALDFFDPRKNKYAYMLTGIDSDWIYADGRRYANYTNIPPGTYSFRVKGSNNDNFWNEAGVIISITIAPPYWRTWWFMLSASAALIGLLVLAYNYRVAKLLEVERTRYRIARDLHDDVGGTLSSISNFTSAIRSEMNENGRGLSPKLLELIGESASEAQEAINDIIWSIDPVHETWAAFLAKCRRYASDLCESRSMAHAIRIPEFIPGRIAQLERRRNIWLIYKELVTNAVKHSNGSDLDVEIKYAGKKLLLSIGDNGKGFDPDIPTDRSGIKNIRTRARELSADLDLQTSPGKGTRWQISIPL